jgi:SAM-dependent methyltransferase
MPYIDMPQFALDDHFLVAQIIQVMNERNLCEVVETGINGGKSTTVFCSIALWVTGVDIDPICIDITERRLLAHKATNYDLRLGNSPDRLRWLVKKGLNANRTLFFLDAHWGDTSWPLPEEILSIPRKQGVLVLHDIKVPDKDFGFDYYVHKGESKPFTIDLIAEQLTEWSPSWRIAYNEQASGSYRGACFVFPD